MPELGPFCSRCGRPESVVGGLSTRGRCAGCGDAAMQANTAQMRDRFGPYWERWAIRCAQAAARELRRARTG